MRWRRVPYGILLPALLVGLVGLLATLQYRWLGQVSEAEREQLSRSLTQRTRELTDDFDREVTQLYLAMQGVRSAAASGDGVTVGDALDRWRVLARYPQMVRGVYLADWADGQLRCRHFNPDTKAFDPGPSAAWPAHLELVRRQLSAHGPPAATAPIPRPSSGNNVQIVAFSLSPLVQDVPALLIPLASPFSPGVAAASDAGRPADRETFRWVELMRASLIVDLDGGYLTTTMLAGMAERHFPGDGAGGYRIAAVDAAGKTLFQRGFPAGARVDPERADVVMPFFGLRIDLVAEQMRGAEAGGRSHPAPLVQGVPLAEQFTIIQRQSGAAGGAIAGGTATTQSPARIAVTMNAETQAGRNGGAAVRTRILPARLGWRLVLQHGAGSLDAAVSEGRRRNLWLSFGILGVLGAGIVLVMANARRSEQLAARQMDFVATVSHELRTPLAVIRSAAQNLSAGVVADPAQARRYGELIEGEGRRLTDMVEQVLDYAGLEGQGRVRAPRPVDVPTLVEEVAEACRPACEAAGCVLELDLGDAGADDAPVVMGDEAALGRVVANLITNAAKHGADGRWIGVRVSSCSVKGGREVLVAVSDRGRGIDASELAHVFEAFRRGRRAIEQQIHGNGLGLSLVKRIVETHGGRVAVTSAPGEGATFVVYLPASGAAGPPEGGSRP